MVTSRGRIGDQGAEKVPIKRVTYIFTVLSLVGLLTSCAPMRTYVTVNEPGTHIMIQDSTTESDHKKLAKYHEDMAKNLWLKASEKKQLLEHYEDKSYLYGKRAQDLKSHTWSLVRNYQQAATANLREAIAHYEQAAIEDLKNADYHRRAASGSAKTGNSASNPLKINATNTNSQQ
jgi:hypothetical protein